MKRVVILGGGNIGDVASRLNHAEALISERVGQIVARSEDHTTEPWGFKCQQQFTNRAIVANTTLAAEDVLEALLAIEAELGRDRRGEYISKVMDNQCYACRMIDLDILLYGDDMVVTPHLQIPHPRLLQREFALVPMCQALGITVEQGQQLVKDIILKR
ncbi:MAG: 2-amino-4-hydroxy-6-hydroxymethyldihydropteridine diphosphokinase [Alistipes sp.]|nr:2-amino-4-hydroxy-6-hydroxymethyldihydropteridine diphosphokinase [Alistipes sp.]